MITRQQRTLPAGSSHCAFLAGVSTYFLRWVVALQSNGCEDEVF